jgi:hypothetical protein
MLAAAKSDEHPNKRNLRIRYNCANQIVFQYSDGECMHDDLDPTNEDDYDDDDDEY